MTNRRLLHTTDFLIFAKSITLKSFFHMIRGTRNRSKIHEKSMQIRCSKKGCKNHEKCSKNASKMGAKIYTNPKKNAVQKLVDFWDQFSATPSAQDAG